MKDNTSFIDKSGSIHHKYYIGSTVGRNGLLCQQVDFFKSGVNSGEWDFVSSKVFPAAGLTKTKIITAFLGL